MAIKRCACDVSVNVIFDIARLLALRGTDGSDIKRRRYGDTCANMLERSQRSIAADLREIKEDERDAEK